MKVKNLVWSLRDRGGKMGTELFAPVPLLEHSVGDAGFTIRRALEEDSFDLIWWHGNRGHHIGVYGAEEQCKFKAQEHLNNLVMSWIEKE